MVKVMLFENHKTIFQVREVDGQYSIRDLNTKFEVRGTQLEVSGMLRSIKEQCKFVDLVVYE